MVLALCALLVPSAQPAEAASITVAAGLVAVNNGDGKCSLIEAIGNANDTVNGQPFPNCAAGNPTGPDTVNLAPGSQYTLSSAFDPLGPTGLPPIQTTIVIKGNGAKIQRGGSAAFFRLFDIRAGGNLTLEDLDLANGFVPNGSGGAIRNVMGTLTLVHGKVTANSATTGGAIYNDSGTVVLTQVDFENNSANSGAAVFNYRGRLNVDVGSFKANTARNGGSGGAIWNVTNSQLDVASTTFSQNESASEGGAIYSSDRSTTTLTRSTLDNNRAATDGGAIYNGSNSRLSIALSTLNNNTAARDGGAIYSKTSTVAPDVEIVNSTLSYNLARDGSGGALYNELGVFSMINATLFGNTASWRGGGVFHNSSSAGLITRTIISGNYAAAGDEVFSQYEGRLLSDYSLYGSSIAAASDAFWNFAPATSDINATNGGGLVPPLNDLNRILDPSLKRNGGVTRNHALPFGSLAVDWAPSADCQAEPVRGFDQRDMTRNVNGSQSIVSERECDIGATERQIGERVVSWWWISILKPGALTLNGAQMDYQPADVLLYDANQDSWSLALDASAAGLSKNVTGLGLLADGSVLVTFGVKQTIPGVGTFTPWDVARISPAGDWSWYLDGSTVGLTTSGEKIDALSVSPDGRLLVSTVGAAAVKNAAGQSFRAQDEDLIAFAPAAGGGSWSLYFDGSTVPGLAVEDIVNASVDPETGDLTLGLADNYTVADLSGTSRDLIVIGRGPENTLTVARSTWNAASVGLSGVIDALELR